MNHALQAFRAVDFNWTRDLQSVWSDPVFQVDALHKSTIDGMMDDFLRFTRRPSDNPIGQVILGEAGVGKTHMIGTLRRRAWQAGGWFVLLDIIGITDFWQTAALGFVSSLRQPMDGAQTQYQALLSAILNVIAKQASFDRATRRAIQEWRDKPNKTRLDTADLFLKLLWRLDPAGAAQHQDVIRALLLLDSDDFDASNLAYCWLQGLNVDDEKRRLLKFSGPPPSHDKLVGGMLWVMGLAGPTLIAVDQIDSIISESNLLVGVDEARADDSERRARHIIETLAGGLMALHDLKRRAMTVVSCLEGTWPVIETKAVKSAAQRFKALPVLERIGSDDIVENLVSGRLSEAYVEAGFHPPYRTWPFLPAAIHSAVGLSPREILIRCDEHRRRCIAAGEVVECHSLAQDAPAARGPSPSRALDEQFERLRSIADISPFLDEKNEDAATSELLIQTCEMFLKHLDLPRAIDAIVKPDPDRNKPSLHARISLTFHDENDRERHYCFRFLGHANAIAFQSRLKAAMTASGIDRALKFRRLFILRRDAPPTGARTRELVDQFTRAGGRVRRADRRRLARLRRAAGDGQARSAGLRGVAARPQAVVRYGAVQGGGLMSAAVPRRADAADAARRRPPVRRRGRGPRRARRAEDGRDVARHSRSAAASSAAGSAIASRSPRSCCRAMWRSSPARAPARPCSCAGSSKRPRSSTFPRSCSTSTTISRASAIAWPTRPERIRRRRRRQGRRLRRARRCGRVDAGARQRQSARFESAARFRSDRRRRRPGGGRAPSGGRDGARHARALPPRGGPEGRSSCKGSSPTRCGVRARRRRPARRSHRSAGGVSGDRQRDRRRAEARRRNRRPAARRDRDQSAAAVGGDAPRS